MSGQVLTCASTKHPASTCSRLSTASPHSLQRLLSDGLVRVLCCIDPYYDYYYYDYDDDYDYDYDHDHDHDYYYYYYYYYYHHHLLYQSLYWCIFCSSDGCKPCTWGIRHTSHSLWSYIKHLTELLLQTPACWSFGSLSQLLSLILSWCFLPYPLLLYQAHHFSFHLPHSLYF